ncbi:hypothetical protein CEXT_637731 [Caerostris extrusa]|uniref:Uncharacterized protein n=1 Tax=Caerostris extrusa TaxID=172846 RepID=A0AAV4MIJ6_CAEEX|nr:hypothetical protein CEXT_637731 [Caerostris extrusa]
MYEVPDWILPARSVVKWGKKSIAKLLLPPERFVGACKIDCRRGGGEEESFLVVRLCIRIKSGTLAENGGHGERGNLFVGFVAGSSLAG